jgi:anti-sigma B factor antagonist
LRLRGEFHDALRRRGITDEEPVTINVRTVDQATILDLNGPFKAGDADQVFRNSVGEVLSAGAANLVINLGGVTFLDSSGVGSLVRTFSMLKEKGGEFRVFGATKQVAQLLRMVRLDKVLGLAEDETAALASF